MVEEEKIDTFWDFLENHFKFFFFLLSFVLLFVSGILLAKIWEFQRKPPLRYEVGESLNGEDTQGVQVNSSLCKTDVSGAVKNPGVYELSEGSRVEDALSAAGGLSAQAAPDWVAKNMNLAARITDGQKIYVPNRQELVDNGASQGTGFATSSSFQAGSSESSDKVNLNQASKAELETLPGIGPALAERIIAHREKTPFSRVEDLTAVSGIGSKTLEDLRDKVFVP